MNISCLFAIIFMINGLSRVSAVTVLNSGFESYTTNQMPSDWEVFVENTAPDNYTAISSTNMFLAGNRSLKLGYYGKSLEADKYLKVRQTLDLEVKKRYLFEINYAAEYLGRVLSFVGRDAHITPIGSPGWSDPAEWKSLKFEWEIPDEDALLADQTVPFSFLVRTFTTNLYIDSINVTQICHDHEEGSLSNAAVRIESGSIVLSDAIGYIKNKLDGYKNDKDANKPWFYLSAIYSILNRTSDYIIEDYNRAELWYANRSIRQLDECLLLADMAYDIIEGIDSNDASVVKANQTYVYNGDVSTIYGRLFRSDMKFHTDSVATNRNMINFGLLGFSEYRDDLEFLGSEKLGCNIISVNVSPKYICTNEYESGDIIIDTDEVIGRIVAPLDSAESNDLQVIVVIGGSLPEWFEAKYGDDVMRSSNILAWDFDVNQADVRRLYSALINAVSAAVEDKASLHSIVISNEPTLEVSDITEVTHLHNEWKAYLAQRFPNGIGEYNDATGLSYASFEEVPGAVDGDLADVNRTAANMIYDEFIRNYFKDFHVWMADLFKTNNPALKLHSKIVLKTRLNNDVAFDGVDVEDWAEFSDILGNDMTYSPNPTNVNSVWASSDSLANALYLDLMGSLKNAPIFNSEAHLIPNGYSSDMQDNHTYTAIWHAALHGQTALTAWVWERWVDGVNLNYKGSLAHYPRQLYGLVKAGHDLNRLIYFVQPFINAKKDVALVYSRAAFLGNPGFYYERIEEAYEALSANGYNVGFITQKQLEDKQFGDYKAIVCAGLTHLSRQALANLRDWESQTVQTNVFRYGVGVFNYDEMGAAHGQGDKPDNIFISYMATTENRIKWFRNNLELIPELNKDCYLKQSVSGDWTWPKDGTLEWRYLEKSGKKYVSVINFAQTPKVFRIEGLSGGTLTDLITQENLGAYNSGVLIPPMTPRLLCVE